MKETENNQSPFREEKLIDLSHAWLINDNTLEPQPERYSSPEKRQFKSDKEFNELISNNTGLLFGKNTLLIDCTLSQLDCYVLLDYSDPDRHLIHFVDVTLSKQNFWEVFARVSKLFTYMASNDYGRSMATVMAGVINENKDLAAEIKTIVDEDDEDFNLENYLIYVLNQYKPFILLISDSERLELEEMSKTYPTNWGKLAIPISMQKCSDDGTLYFVSTPEYTEIEWTYGKVVEAKPKSIEEKTKKSTEEDHLNGTQDSVKEVYQKIKDDLLNLDASLEFNPKQYYISLRKGKNLAFFHIKKKLITVVVMCPEKETRKLIKHHEVKTLTEKVQKFWNGECCNIVIDKADKLEEVITLLKNLIK
jgi:predicted transport protein